ncbi:PIN domain-containing protein [Citricoccus muralis]|uniref:PIN domain-containing protein n=1 Tax=Citricoccus muralis TaxID=169134 RepID=A0A3D9LDF0_9MICC|nr:PIN domain-containing protein [Citricoccus muralis]REE04255.1 PIN domain-containing protein [Citricoccus muralis]
MTQRVFLDANVLYSRTLRDWLFKLRLETRGGMFQLHTTWDVIAETSARLRDNHPEAPSSLISGLMEKIEMCVDEVITVYPGGPVEGIADAGDWHVHHAAEACRADVLITEDEGFNSDDAHYEVYSCDEFFLEVGRSAPDVVQSVAQQQASYWAQRGGKQLPDALRDAKCGQFAEVILNHLKALAAAGHP